MNTNRLRCKAAALLVFAICCLPADEAGALGLLDQYAADQPVQRLDYTVADLRPVGQEFTPHFYTLGGVAVWLSRASTQLGPRSTLTVKIHKGTISAPTLLSQARIVPTFLEGLYSFQFAPGIAVVPGEVYVLEVDSDLPIKAWRAYGTNSYPGGDAITQGTNAPGIDFQFATYSAEGAADVADILRLTIQNYFNGSSGGHEPIDKLLRIVDQVRDFAERSLQGEAGRFLLQASRLIAEVSDYGIAPPEVAADWQMRIEEILSRFLPAGREDQHYITDCASHTATSSLLENSQPLGQQFVPELTTLSAVAIELATARINDFGLGRIAVNIRKGTATSDVLASRTVTVPHVFEGVLHFQLPAPISVVPGDTYVLEVIENHRNHTWRACQPSFYLAGEAIINGTNAPTRDFHFATYGVGSGEEAIGLLQSEVRRFYEPGTVPDAANAIIETLAQAQEQLRHNRVEDAEDFLSEAAAEIGVLAALGQVPADVAAYWQLKVDEVIRLYLPEGLLDQFSNRLCGQANSYTIAYFGRVGQEFTPWLTTLAGVAVELVRANPHLGTTSDITVNIRNGTIFSEILASKTMTVSRYYEGLLYYEFDEPLSVVPNRTYVLEVKANNPIQAWVACQSDTYPGGDGIIYGMTSVNLDWQFATYGVRTAEEAIDVLESGILALYTTPGPGQTMAFDLITTLEQAKSLYLDGQRGSSEQVLVQSAKLIQQMAQQGLLAKGVGTYWQVKIREIVNYYLPI